MMFAGFLRREPVEMVPCETCDLEVPANAEIVLEGYVDLKEMRTEGPFGDHTGFYSLEGEFPVFHVTCITQRRDPIYLTTVVGPPPQEDFFMGHAVERIFLPVMKMQYPEIVDVAMPAEGVFHNLMIVSIRKSYPGHARKIMHAIWSLGQAMFTKVVVVVDHDVNVQNSREVVWKSLCAIDPRAGCGICDGPGGHAGPCLAHSGLRLEDGNRRHAQMGKRRIPASLAGRNCHGRCHEKAHRRDLADAGSETIVQSSRKGVWKAHTSNSSPSIH